MALTRDQILQVDDLTKQEVKVPQWGGSVIVSTMSGKSRDSWEQSLMSKGNGNANMENIRARLVAFTVVDEHGNPLFTEADIEALGRKSGAALDRVVKVAQKLNKLTDADLEEAKGN